MSNTPLALSQSAQAATERAVKSAASPIYVAQPALPPLQEFIPYLEEIWANKILTSGGPFHQQLEKSLCDYLGLQHLALFSNGTLGLVTALQALRVTGEVITTPYSFVATAHSLQWNGIKPVFVDVHPDTLNIDPSRIEAAITPQTTAIMPVHCYGHPCDVQAIQKIVDNYNLKVIYDAAHAFGMQDAGSSLLRHGDLSVLRFHATKVFNTFEGGAIICSDAKTKMRIARLKNTTWPCVTVQALATCIPRWTKIWRLANRTCRAVSPCTRTFGRATCARVWPTSAKRSAGSTMRPHSIGYALVN